MIDHISLAVTVPDVSTDFYAKALAPLGYAVVMEMGPVRALGAAGEEDRKAAPELWLVPEQHPTTIHLALAAASPQQVDAFHAAALAAGGRDNGGPGERAHYHPGYYAAFVLDPDGHNLEVVCHNGPVGQAPA
ncbi:VOC family protein [Actinomyces marmotae]|uniref:VOC family protein n=1 Tax=Actinomyces marmotae TaxID=2737173 RepID=A0A6M8B6H6_9ACTO|nr:VOC family protein [Actinomyces marmotae]QKD79706.1 VOC family protein [Actinomyces marmotae]